MSMLAQLRTANAFDASDRGARRRAVRERLQQVLAHALAHSRFYARQAELLRELVRETDDERFFARFRELTPLTKHDLGTRFDDLVTDPELTLERVREFDSAHSDGLGILQTKRAAYQAIKTSGTSGNVVYMADTIANIKQIMSLVLFRALVRVLYQSGLVLVLLPLFRPLYMALRRRRMPREPKSPPAKVFRPGLRERITRFFKPCVLVFVHRGNRSVYRGTTSHSQPWWSRLLFHVPVISHEESLASILAQTQWLQPEFMFGLPSRIEWLARAQLAGELAIDPLAVYVGGETLHAELLELFRKAWPHALIVNTYGATETKVIATACPDCHELHLCEDIVYFELEDEEGRPVRDDEPAARVYATSLRNAVIPVLRYEMTDNVVPLPEADCRWRTRRIRVKGREPAFLWVTHRASGEWIPLNGRMLKESLVAIPDTTGFMVRHPEPGCLQLSFVVSKSDDACRAQVERAGRVALEALARDQGSSLSDLIPDVAIHVYDADGWNQAGGKLNTIASNVKPPTLRAPAREAAALPMEAP
jgi:phenylacetate-CoA ligase